MPVIVAIEFHSREDLERSLQIASHEFDVRNEEFDHCIARERGKEVITCRDLGIPYLAFESRSNRILDANVDTSDIPEDTRVFVRKSIGSEPDILGLEPVFTLEDDDKVSRWPDHIINPETYLKRSVTVVPHDDFVKQVKDNTLPVPCFVKTLDKGRNMQATLHHVIDETNVRLFNFNENKPMMFDYDSEESSISFLFEGQMYYNEYLGDDYRSHDMNHSLVGDFILSDVMSIESDGLSDKGTVEYRCFVIADEVVNASRYTDFDSLKVPLDAIEFAKGFARDHNGIFGDTYVLDIAKTDKGHQIVELNPTPNSGRYLDNDPVALYKAVRRAFGQDNELTVTEPQVAVPDPQEHVDGNLTLGALFSDEFGPA